MENHQIRESYEKDLAEAKKKLKNTKFILIFAALLLPLGFYFSLLVTFLIITFFVILWGVSTYISFMHYISAKNRLNKFNAKL